MITRPDLQRLAALVREDPVPQDWFHKTFAASPSKTAGKNPPPDPVCEVIKAEMAARGWSVRDLAARMEGDTARNRAMLSLFLSDPLPLGPPVVRRIAQALGVPESLLEPKEGA